MIPPTTAVDTRERILAAACDVIDEKSFAGAGLNEILQRAGVPKGSFYHYFKSKEDLGVAVVDRAVAQCTAEVEPVLQDRRRGAFERLRALFVDYRESCEGDCLIRGCLIGKLALESANLSEAVHAAVKHAYSQWTALLARLVRESQSDGDIAAGHDPEQLAGLLVGLWEGTLIRARVERSLAPIDAAIAFFFDSGFLTGPR